MACGPLPPSQTLLKVGGGLMSVLLCYPDRGRGQGVAHVGPDLPLRDVAGYLGAVRSHPCPAAWLSPERLHVSKHAAMFGSLFLNFWGKTFDVFVLICEEIVVRNTDVIPGLTPPPGRARQLIMYRFLKMFFTRNCYFLSQLKPRLLFNKIIFKLSRSLFEFKLNCYPEMRSCCDNFERSML